MVRAGLSLGRAQSLVARLGEEGWQVQVAQDGLALRDLAWICAMVIVFGVTIPWVGMLVGAVLGLWWRSQHCQPQLRQVLPGVRASVPPRSALVGGEYSVSAGLLLFATAGLLAWWPVAAVVPAVLLLWLARTSLRAGYPDLESLARRGRTRTLLAELRRLIESQRGDLDSSLVWLGELEELERSWTSGDVRDAHVLVRAEALWERVACELPRDDEMGVATLEALRRSGTELRAAPVPASPDERGEVAR